MSVTVKDAEKDKTEPKADVAPATDTAPADEVVEVVDPRELLIRKPMPIRRHTVVRADGKKMAILLQGLSYLEKQGIDTRSRTRRVEDEERVEAGELDAVRPSLWAPEIVTTAMCKPDGRRAYRDEEVRAAAMQYAEQLADGELQAAADVVLDLSGWGKDSAMRAGKASRKTPSTV